MKNSSDVIQKSTDELSRWRSFPARSIVLIFCSPTTTMVTYSMPHTMFEFHVDLVRFFVKPSMIVSKVNVYGVSIMFEYFSTYPL